VNVSHLYRAFSTGTNSRQLFRYDETFFNNIQKVVDDKGGELDYYESIYLYTPDHFKTFKKTHSLSGITDVKTDRLVFDFDSTSDLEVARQDAVDLVGRLMKILNSSSPIRIFYSGNKGFHVELHLNDLLSRAEFSNIVDNFAGDLETFDKRIRDEQRLFRFPMTRHQKTGRYKIPLTVDQLSEMEIGTIEIMAVDPAVHEEDFQAIMASWTPIDLPPQMAELKNIDTKEKKKEREEKIISEDRPDLSRKPRHLTSAKYALQEGFFEDGERNEACMILASTYRFLGYNKLMAYKMLKATLELRAMRLGHEGYDKEELWNTVIEIVYSPTWKGGTYTEDESYLLKKVIQRYNLRDEYQEKSIVSVTEVSNKFLTFAKNIDQNTIKTGIAEIDENVLITTGMMVGLLGAPSSGKTTHALSFLEHQSKNNSGAFFVSADMPDTLAFGRLMQRYCGWDLRKILDTIKVSDYKAWPNELRTAWDQVNDDFKNVGFSFQSGPTVEDIRTKVDDYEQATGRKVRVLVVDYLEKVRCNLNDATAASGYNAARLADLTRDKEMATILLLQPQKSAGDPSDELLSMRKVKGASVIEQDCRVILTTWRPGFNPGVPTNENQDDRYSCISVVKNNMGSTGTMNFHWDGIRGRIRSLSMEEKYDFERVVQETKARKDAEKNGSNDLFESQQDYKTSRPKTPYEAKMAGKKGRGINDEGNGDLF
jgi:replicative DNA helicase